MKKLFNKFKKIIFSVGIFLATLPSKIFAVDIDSFRNVDILYGPPETLYGIPRVSPIKRIWVVARNIVIPIILLIGLIIYFKKSKSSKKKKIIVAICVVLITALVYFIVNNIINNYI